MKTLLKIFLKLWIVFHLVGILIMPMPQSILTKSWGPFFQGYLNQLGINTTWNLFSPEPAEPLWMNVQLISPEYETGVKNLTFPRFGNTVDRNPAHRREYYQMRQMLLAESRVQEFFIPWICRQNPGVTEVSLEVYRKRVPGLERAHLESRTRIEELSEVHLVREFRDLCQRDL